MFFKESSPIILEPLIFLNSIILLYILKFYYDYLTRSVPYPGPFPLPIVGNLHQFYYHKNNIPSWLHQLSLRYGDVFELYFGSNKYLMISNSRVVERIMTSTRDSNYFMRVATKKGLDDLQKGNIGILFNSEFDYWSYVRKILMRVVGSPNALRSAVNLVGNIFCDLEKFWNNLIEEQGQFLNNEQEKSVEIDFVPWSKRVFAETTMLMTASQRPNVLSAYYNRITNRNLQRNSNEEFLDRLFIASDCVQYYVTVPPLIRNFPIINIYTNYLCENLTWTRNYAYNLTKERRKEIESIDDKEKLTPDMLNMLLTANTSKDITQGISNENNRKPMTDEEVGDNILEIFSEGIDGPSNTLAFIIYCVWNNPDVEQRILDEIEKVFDRESDFKITYEDLSKLIYIEAVIKEVLRVRPATATISRFSAHLDQFDNYKIPPSTQLAINVVGLHNNQNYWKEPTKFDPSRFLSSSNDKNEVHDKNAFMNFGGGLRMCPGRHFAMTQLKIMIVLLYSKYNFEVITKDPSTQFNVNIQCKELKVRIKHRK